jgi:alkylated DNA nucleotide flippase Atl1
MSPKPKSLTPWREKRDKPQEPMVVKIEGKMRERFGPGRMVIATPKIIDGIVRKIPEGKLVTVGQIMGRLCADYKTDAACPMTTGIFLNIVAKAAEEDRAQGHEQITPYWRVLKTKGALNPKFPGGMEAHAAKLEAEGHEIDRTRKTWKVESFEKRLAEL